MVFCSRGHIKYIPASLERLLPGRSLIDVSISIVMVTTTSRREIFVCDKDRRVRSQACPYLHHTASISPISADIFDRLYPTPCVNAARSMPRSKTQRMYFVIPLSKLLARKDHSERLLLPRSNLSRRMPSFTERGRRSQQTTRTALTYIK